MQERLNNLSALMEQSYAEISCMSTAEVQIVVQRMGRETHYRVPGIITTPVRWQVIGRYYAMFASRALEKIREHIINASHHYSDIEVKMRNLLSSLTSQQRTILSLLISHEIGFPEESAPSPDVAIFEYLSLRDFEWGGILENPIEEISEFARMREPDIPMVLGRNIEHRFNPLPPPRIRRGNPMRSKPLHLQKLIVPSGVRVLQKEIDRGHILAADAPLYLKGIRHSGIQEATLNIPECTIDRLLYSVPRADSWRRTLFCEGLITNPNFLKYLASTFSGYPSSDLELFVCTNCPRDKFDSFQMKSFYGLSGGAKPVTWEQVIAYEWRQLQQITHRNDKKEKYPEFPPIATLYKWGILDVPLCTLYNRDNTAVFSLMHQGFLPNKIQTILPRNSSQEGSSRVHFNQDEPPGFVVSWKPAALQQVRSSAEAQALLNEVCDKWDFSHSS